MHQYSSGNGRPLAQRYIEGTLAGSDLAQFEANLKADLRVYRDAVLGYLSGSISARSLYDSHRALVKRDSEAISYLQRESSLKEQFDELLMCMALYDGNPEVRKSEPLLVGDEEVMASAKSFLQALERIEL